MDRTSRTLLAVLLCLAPGTARAQGQLIGVVVDSAGNPIANALVTHTSSGRETRTDGAGKFRIRNLPLGSAEFSVRRIGFLRSTASYQVDSVASVSARVVLASAPTELDAVEVTERFMRHRLNIEGFYDRTRTGVGSYITREEILERGPFSTVDLFRTVPGIRVFRARGIEGIRFNSSSSMRRDCIPMLWIDGQRAPGMEVGDVPWRDIEGIELYKGPSTTPMQFSQGPSTISCGTVVVWTRPPPPSDA